MEAFWAKGYTVCHTKNPKATKMNEYVKEWQASHRSEVGFFPYFFSFFFCGGGYGVNNRYRRTGK